MQPEHHFAVVIIKNCHEYLIKVQGQFNNQMIGNVGSWGLFLAPITNIKWTECTHGIVLANSLFQNTPRTLQKELQSISIVLQSEKIVYHPILFHSSFFEPTVLHDYPLWINEELLIKAIYNDEFATHKLFAPGMIEILKQVISE